ncbi:MAG: DNA replication/repair protein RecF [Lachnospiraceae bacterium]|nr:DNA replication/repair protein RecF [Lachnospiraceae bacterium]
MRLESLDLTNFRNYETGHIEFSGGTDIFYGKNAQGKTNILEGICVSALTRSHRSAKDKEMIRFGEKEAHVRCVIRKAEIPMRLDVHLRARDKKALSIDSQRQRRAADFIGNLKVVFFSPEDLGIIKNGPAERRRFMDMQLCQMDRTYLSDLTGYTKLVNQRNSLLEKIKDAPGLKTTLDIIDEQTVDYGTRVINRRVDFLNDLSDIAGKIHSDLTSGREELVLKYEPDVDGSSYMDRMVANRDRDIYSGHTNAGPHRDDISVISNGENLRKYGSQGQIRTAALSLKLAETEMIKNFGGDTPILLLDDVLSELDRERQRQLLSSIGDVQTLVTCTDIQNIEGHLEYSRSFLVNKGTVTMQTK